MIFFSFFIERIFSLLISATVFENAGQNLLKPLTLSVKG